MRIRSGFICLIVAIVSFSCVYAQDAEKKDQPTEERPTIVLASGQSMLVDEVFERDGGYWYKLGKISTFLDRDRVSRIEFPKSENEAAAPAEAKPPGKWRLSEADKVKAFFLVKFNKPLPLSAFGQSDLHTRWGLDHRNAMDVGLHPDSVEGRALINYLRAEAIPFLVFRAPIPGVATGPHIHIGNRSSRTYGR
jgi:hypothetical protein